MKFLNIHSVGKNWLSQSHQNVETQSLKKEFTVFPANSQSKAFPFLTAVILSLFRSLMLNR